MDNKKKNAINYKLSKTNLLYISTILVFLLLVSLSTSYLGSTDVGDYAGAAKFFSGDYNAKIRSSHSMLYGVIHFPLFFLFKSFIMLKIVNLIYLFLIILSTYILSNKDKRALFLIILSPIIWYMGPWINSIQLSSLVFLWSYYFIKKFEKEEKISFLLISGLFAGLSWAFWDSIMFFSLLLGISFLYNKKFYHFIIFLFSLFLGLIPKLIVDQILFNFPFYGVMRYFFGMATSIFFGGVYGNMTGSINYLFNLIFLLLFIPLISYKIISKNLWKNEKSSIILIMLSLTLILLNFQLRYILLIYPIILLNVKEFINKKNFIIQIIISIFLISLIITPYIMQINYTTNAEELNSFLINLNNLKIQENQEKILIRDLNLISKDFPNEVFVVGNLPDSYADLAMIYWGKNIQEFVSIENYKLYSNDELDLFSKTLYFNPNINERRAIWISGGIRKNPNDNTNYSSIRYAISNKKTIPIEDFKLIKEYQKLNVFERII